MGKTTARDGIRRVEPGEICGFDMGPSFSNVAEKNPAKNPKKQVGWVIKLPNDAHELAWQLAFPRHFGGWACPGDAEKGAEAGL